MLEPPHARTGYSFEVDVWALGVIMYTMLVGQGPFQASKVEKIYEKIKHGDYKFPEDTTIS